MDKKKIDGYLWNYFYKDAFLRILNIKIDGIPKESSFSEFLKIYQPSNDSLIKENLTRYIRELAPAWKANLIKQSIEKYTIHPIENMRILDYGCGSCCLQDELSLLLRGSTEIIGYEPNSIDKKPNVFSNKSKLRPSSEFDLVLSTFVFHHISSDLLDLEISWIKSLLKKEGYLFILEDCWETTDNIPTSSKELFMRNEYWSNEWTFGKKLSVNSNGYKSLENWTTILEQNGLKVVNSNSFGSESYRLHPLPFSLIVCKKSSYTSKSSQ